MSRFPPKGLFRFELNIMGKKLWRVFYSYFSIISFFSEVHRNCRSILLSVIHCALIEIGIYCAANGI